ncbi:mechanosensitive ion channel family protein [Peptococcus simiae]|uniref:Mechanosensitive ion channel family protein n=1 Tax=Peptococcus simiae TaxID=1643805 RepID=A0ABW9GZI5_9FIRM
MQTKLWMAGLATFLASSRPAFAADSSEVAEAKEVAKEAASAGADAAVDQLNFVAQFFTADRLGAYALNGIRIFILLLVVFVIWRIGRFFIRRIMRQQRRGASAAGGVQLTTAGHLIESIFNYFMIFISIMGILSIIGFDIRGLVASAGLAGVLIAFVSQSIIKDWVSGLFTLIERNYDVGDRILAAGHEGEVLSIGMRSTVLRTDYGETVYIPNGLIDVVVNFSKYPNIVFLDVPVSCNYRNAEVRAALEAVCETFNAYVQPNENLYSPAEVLDIAAFEPGRALWRLTFASGNLSHWTHGRQLRVMIKDEFDRRGLTLAYDQMVIREATGPNTDAGADREKAKVGQSQD